MERTKNMERQRGASWQRAIQRRGTWAGARTACFLACRSSVGEAATKIVAFVSNSPKWSGKKARTCQPKLLRVPIALLHVEVRYYPLRSTFMDGLPVMRVRAGR